jgi:hypothetical protein
MITGRYSDSSNGMSEENRSIIHDKSMENSSGWNFQNITSDSGNQDRFYPEDPIVQEYNVHVSSQTSCDKHSKEKPNNMAPELHDSDDDIEEAAPHYDIFGEDLPNARSESRENLGSSNDEGKTT